MPIKKFKVLVEEIRVKEVVVEAKNRDEATRIVSDRHANGELVLTADDFFAVGFRPTEITEKEND